MDSEPIFQIAAFVAAKQFVVIGHGHVAQGRGVPLIISPDETLTATSERFRFAWRKPKVERGSPILAVARPAILIANKDLNPAIV